MGKRGIAQFFDGKKGVELAPESIVWLFGKMLFLIIFYFIIVGIKKHVFG